MGHSEERQRVRAKLYAALDKEFGKGAGRPLTERTVEALPRVSTGSLLADWVTGGGLPRGRIIEFYGAESSGKTTLALSTMAQAQRAGLEVAYIDAEHALNQDWAQRVGVDVDSMLYDQPDTGEEALRMVELMIRNGVQFIVIDSVAALTPKAEIEGDIGDSHVGLQARLMSQTMRILTGPVQKNQVVLLFINQTREKVGVMFGSPETTSGGKALKFYASIRLDIKKGAPIKHGDQRIGDTIKLTAVKNKTAPPHRKAEVPLLYDRGIDRVGELVDLGLTAEILTRSGAYYSYGDRRLGQGREAAIEVLAADPALLDGLGVAARHFLETGEVGV